MVGPDGKATVCTLEPESLEAISTAMAEAPGQVAFNAGRSVHPFALPTPYRRFRMKNILERQEADMAALSNTTAISLDRYRGVIEHDVDDQVVVVRAGTALPELQEELAKVGQCIPMPELDPQATMAVSSTNGPLIDEIGFNLPHGLTAQCGSWRDWILGMKVVLPDGTMAKCGSKAVKNVAGYDVQKLMIGSRGTLALIAEVTLRTFPLKALPKSELHFAAPGNETPSNWIQRVLPSDFEEAVNGGQGWLTAFDRPSSTLWAIVSPEKTLKRFEGDWVLRSGCGMRNLEFADPTIIRLMKRTKELFDPTNKMNQGEMGL